ncbi:MAG: glycine--tRNA ligase [Nanoarchaeota archaeon]|nr:glycine--tRNA ligase [Nanoarchaeota archaeon]
MEKLSIEDMAVFCKRKGFVYPNSEIYGGFSGFWDFGHLGVELKNNIKNEWWNYHVTQREDIVGIDGSIITHPKVWEASGHVANFTDLMLTTKKTKTKIRADQFIEEKLNIAADGLTSEEINKLIKKHKLKHNGEDIEELKDFNLMFETSVGPDKGQTAFLRPETAQLIFTDFRLVVDNARLKLPFGIAQIGKGFRNEISPRDFLFRCREFDMMEIEYFVHPDKDECPLIREVLNYELNFYSAEMQEKGKKPLIMKVKDALRRNMISEWHAYWLAVEQKWFTDLGAKSENFRVRQHLKKEKSHYALDTWDLEYNFPFGWKELEGIANRTDFDLQQHMQASGKDLRIYDEETKDKIIPHVIAEPSLGVERAFLVFMFDAYVYDKKRNNVVLKLNPKLAPVKVAVFPLVSNKPQLTKKAIEVYSNLKKYFNVFYDESGSIGRRYARQDEIGTPLCITIDFDSIKKNDVTIRDRNSTKQIRVKIKDLGHKIWEYMNGVKFEKLGKTILK